MKYLDFMLLAEKCVKVLFAFWQYKPEKYTRPLKLHKDTVWYGLIA
jgi:hypothetical protein